LTVINAAMMSALCIKQLDRFRKKNKKYKLGSGVQSAANVLGNVVPMTLFGKNGSSGSGSGNDETLKTMCHNLIQNNLPVRAESLSVCCPCETSGTVSPHDIYRCRDCGLCVCGDTVPRKDACTHNLAVASHDLHMHVRKEERKNQINGFEEQLRQQLPLSFQLAALDDKLAATAGFDMNGAAKGGTGVLTEGMEFLLTKLERGNGKWTVTYIARGDPVDLAELVIHLGRVEAGTNKLGVLCLLRCFGPAIARVRGKVLPCAKMFMPMNSNSTSDCIWEIPAATQNKTNVEIELRGEGERP
jgi:hypothetical protein